MLSWSNWSEHKANPSLLCLQLNFFSNAKCGAGEQIIGAAGFFFAWLWRCMLLSSPLLCLVCNPIHLCRFVISLDLLFSSACRTPPLWLFDSSPSVLPHSSFSQMFHPILPQTPQLQQTPPYKPDYCLSSTK